VNTPRADYDSPWKEAIERFFPDFLAFFFPLIHEAVDWTITPDFMDGELQHVVRNATTGRLHTDKLVRIQRHTGDVLRLFIHIEVQSQYDAEFAERMFDYYRRLRDRFDEPVVSVAVLADAGKTWRPSTYEQSLLGHEITMRFPMVKLYDYRAEREALAASRNPFALVVEAHLSAQDTAGLAPVRRGAKLGLVRQLYRVGYMKEDLLELYRLIDWLLDLPMVEERLFLQDVAEIEEEVRMRYITSAERIGREDGLAEGLAEGLVLGKLEGALEGQRKALRRIVAARFGAVSPDLEARLAAADETVLGDLLMRAITVVTIADL